ncbi:MAG: hypothetical protein L7W43_10945 [Rubripirellula sp.]|nr:hypothetical protein [Rubripirellula sp.]
MTDLRPRKQNALGLATTPKQTATEQQMITWAKNMVARPEKPAAMSILRGEIMERSTSNS